MAETEARGSRSYELEKFDLLTKIHGMISASRIDPIVWRVWEATGDIREVRELLEIIVQDRPEVKRILERVLEYEGNLVTSSRIVKRIPKK